MLNKTKKIILGLILLIGIFNANASTKKTKPLSIVCTIFPEYDWTKEILGTNPSNIQLTMLLDNGVDLHSYQPTVNDIVKISTCDVFIFIGGESDAWVKDALKEVRNKNIVVINVMDLLKNVIKEEELVPGMQKSEHEHDLEEVHEEEIEYDEHVWLSLKNAMSVTKEISLQIQKLDPTNSIIYKKNTDHYLSQLKSLDNQFAITVNNASLKTILVADRFPFRYLVDDYAINYYAAFVGCSAETEASFKTVIFLANKIDTLGLKTILTIEGPSHKVAETIKKNTTTKDQTILSLDSMQATTSKDVRSGTTYLSIMTNNINTLTHALNNN